MNYVFGKECAKHPELAGKRYHPSNTCISCQREWNRNGGQRQRDRLKACEALLAAMLADYETPITQYAERIEKVLSREI